jgi:hypothetical protein
MTAQRSLGVTVGLKKLDMTAQGRHGTVERCCRPSQSSASKFGPGARDGAAEADLDTYDGATDVPRKHGCLQLHVANVNGLGLGRLASGECASDPHAHHPMHAQCMPQNAVLSDACYPVHAQCASHERGLQA